MGGRLSVGTAGHGIVPFLGLATIGCVAPGARTELGANTGSVDVVEVTVRPGNVLVAVEIELAVINDEC
jgi:hypothetical protein